MQKEENGFAENDELSFEDEAMVEWFSSIFPKNYITAINIQKYKSVQSAVFKIKSIVDKCCVESGESPDDVGYKVVQTGFYKESVGFLVYVPGDGFAIKRKYVDEICKCLPDDAKITFWEGKNHTVAIGFDFKDVFSVISKGNR